MQHAEFMNLVERTEDLAADRAHPGPGNGNADADHIVKATERGLHHKHVPTIRRLKLVVAHDNVGLLDEEEVGVLIVEPRPVIREVLERRADDLYGYGSPCRVLARVDRSLAADAEGARRVVPHPSFRVVERELVFL